MSALLHILEDTFEDRLEVSFEDTFEDTLEPKVVRRSLHLAVPRSYRIQRSLKIDRLSAEVLTNSDYSIVTHRRTQAKISVIGMVCDRWLKTIFCCRKLSEARYRCCYQRAMIGGIFIRIGGELSVNQRALLDDIVKRSRAVWDSGWL